MSVCSHGSLPLADGTIHLQLIGRLQIWLGIGPTYSWLKCKIPCSLEYRTMSTCVALGLLEWVSMLASVALSVVPWPGGSGPYPSCGPGLTVDNVL